MRLVAHLFVCAALFGCAPVLPSGLSGPAILQHQAALSARVDPTVNGKATGYVLITQGDTELMARGYGSLDGRIPPPPRDTAFDIASISKLFTAVSILRLVDQGRIALDDPVRKYLPELPANFQDITVRHALQHDAGFPPYLSGDDHTPKTSAQVLAEIAAIERDRKAGMGFRYSDVGYAVLALTIERVSGQDFRSALRQLVFRPAGLTGTGFYGDDIWRSRPVATQFVKGEPKGSPAAFDFTYNLGGTGQVATTVDDLRRLFMQVSSGRFLSRPSRTVLFSPGISTGERLPYRGPDVLDVTYGMGLFHFRDRKGRLAHGHGGANDFGAHAFVYWRPADKLFVAALFNSGMIEGTFRRSQFMTAATGTD